MINKKTKIRPTEKDRQTI